MTTLSDATEQALSGLLAESLALSPDWFLEYAESALENAGLGPLSATERALLAERQLAGARRALAERRPVHPEIVAAHPELRREFRLTLNAAIPGAGAATASQQDGCRELTGSSDTSPRLPATADSPVSHPAVSCVASSLGTVRFGLGQGSLLGHSRLILAWTLPAHASLGIVSSSRNSNSPLQLSNTSFFINTRMSFHSSRSDISARHCA